MSAHTPTARFVWQPATSTILVTGPDDLIAFHVEHEYGPGLVRAANAYDELVAALREIVDADDGLSPELDRARNALATAGAA